MRNTFKAYERLKREQYIDTLFRTGKAFSFSPVKFIYRTVQRGAELSPVQVGFSVPKKKFRHSVQRHRITRQMREAWRLHKQALYAAIPADIQVHIFIVFLDNKLPDYQPLEQVIVKGMERLQNEFKAPDA